MKLSFSLIAAALAAIAGSAIAAPAPLPRNGPTAALSSRYTSQGKAANALRSAAAENASTAAWATKAHEQQKTQLHKNMWSSAATTHNSKAEALNREAGQSQHNPVAALRKAADSKQYARLVKDRAMAAYSNPQ